MRNWKKMMAVMVTLFCLALMANSDTVSAAKAKKVSMNMTGTKTRYQYPAALDKAKKAFKIQNQYRKEKGVASLEWSDELYQ